ncbi:MAG: helix-turn-helix domain-containing protein [Acidovorax sp.]|uniref:helix-turn-helix domain-containing protein n=1 Tax=Acidovorax sp. TaxID=1872122 RepID=UPI0039E6C5F9
MKFSSSADAQRARALEALRTGPKTSYDLRRLGLYQAPARILELRRAGYLIETHPVTVVDADGYEHPGVALYTLVEEPSPEEAT